MTSSGYRLNITDSIDTVQGHDGYAVAVRRWCPDQEIDAQVIILHGVVSHSDWLRPVAERLARIGIEVICPDRRGAGLNTLGQGDAVDARALIEDVRIVAENYAKSSIPLHIAGFCWGATYAICCIEKLPATFDSLILIAPSIFPADDIANTPLVTSDSSSATEIPLVPIDRFTTGPAYREYIIPDKLRTRAVSPRFNSIMVRMTSMIAPRWARLTLPILMIIASDDRLADNNKHEKAFEVLKAPRKRKVVVSGEHGVQFDAPGETATAISSWLNAFDFPGEQ